MTSRLFGRYRDLVIVALLLALPFVFFLSNAKDPREHTLFDHVVLTLSAPVQWTVSAALNGSVALWQGYVALVGAQERNAELERENSQLREALAIREEQRLENERLRLLLGVRERTTEVPMVLARVIATSPNPLFRSLRIDRGGDDGVRPGSPVMTHDGAVGRVVTVASDFSDVMLLVDANFSTDVIVQRTRARARVRGGGSDKALGLRVEQMPRTADAEPGDVVITSGVGGVFPKGLRLGRLVSVERRSYGLYKHAVLEPTVDFSRLEEVLVLTEDWSSETSFERRPSVAGRDGFEGSDRAVRPPLRAEP